MSKFITRVELHNAEGGDYVTLHQAMESAGFTRTIRGDNGVLYHLPWAEYYCDVNGTAEAVLEAAKNAVAQTRRFGGVLVSELVRAVWNGLDRA